MIEVRGLSKSYGAVLAVDQLGLVVAPGEIVGLVGVNGAGKTTLMRMLAGILEPSAGSITIAGLPLVGDAVAARARLAFVPDTPSLFDALTVREHLLFAGRLYDVPDPAPRIEALLERFTLAEKADAPAGSLSRGMRQKVAICCAWMHEPAVLLLDEPLTGLDPPGRKSMCDAIAERAAAGSAVLVSSHQLEIVERLSQRFVLMHRGRIRLAGTLDEIRAGAAGASLEDVFIAATLDEPA